jgi:hypothetical protein
MEGPALGFKSQIIYEMGEKWLNCKTWGKILRDFIDSRHSGSPQCEVNVKNASTNQVHRYQGSVWARDEGVL